MTACLVWLLALAVDGLVAIPATGAKPESDVESLFGRSRWILIYDTADQRWHPVDNSTGVQAAGGVGIQAAQLLIHRGVKVVLTGQCGPKALQALSAAGIKVFKVADGTVTEALRDYQEGRLKPLNPR
jgi:predicted Fe-Mo cluster-binding NifX family protein